MPLTGSDVGVTADAIKLGIVVLDFTTVNALGVTPPSYTIENQRKAYQAQIDAINERGGIHGRTIQTVYAQADPFRPDSALAACTSLTEDHKVFAVLAFAGFTTDGMLCIARQHQTPVAAFSGYAPDEVFEQSGGRLLTDGMSGNRVMFNWVNELHRLGKLNGKKIGIVYSNSGTGGDRQNVEQGLLPALEQFGYQVAYRAKLSEDLQISASQIPVEVRQMRTAGVDTVLLAVSFIQATQWVQTADSQRWRPTYFVSDHQGLAICEPCFSNMPESFDGTIGFTVYHYPGGGREGLPEPEPDRACRETYNRRTGENMRWGDQHPFANACVETMIFERVTTAAGRNPTRNTWAASAPELGDFPLPTLYGGGFNGKTNYGDLIVTVEWDSACQCYHPIDQPRRARF